MIRFLRWPLYPPIWFLGHLGFVVALLRLSESTTRWWPGQVFGGNALIGLGLLLTVVAIITVRRTHTPVLPYRQPERLITSGPFRFSRNPIYLGEALILTGLSLRGANGLPFLGLPSFILGLTWGAIRWEEAALLRTFGSTFRDYCQRTRRWL